MDERADRVAAHQTEQPHDQQDHGDLIDLLNRYSAKQRTN
jgi:hypothetical protein